MGVNGLSSGSACANCKAICRVSAFWSEPLRSQDNPSHRSMPSARLAKPCARTNASVCSRRCAELPPPNRSVNIKSAGTVDAQRGLLLRTWCLMSWSVMDAPSPCCRRSSSTQATIFLHTWSSVSSRATWPLAFAADCANRQKSGNSSATARLTILNVAPLITASWKSGSLFFSLDKESRPCSLTDSKLCVAPDKKTQNLRGVTPRDRRKLEGFYILEICKPTARLRNQLLIVSTNFCAVF